MEPYQTLATIYQAVKDTKHPSSYICNPADIILHLTLPWENIAAHLKQLEQEGMTKFHNYNGGIAFSITDAGISKVKSHRRDLTRTYSF